MEEIDLKELFNVLVKKMYIIVLTTIFCALLGFIYSKFIVTPMYNSSTSFVLSKSENGQNTSITQNDLTLNSKLVSTYGAIIKSKTIASSVIKELGLNMTEEQLLKNISVSEKSDTDLILVTVSDENPQTAAKIANAIVQAFKIKVNEVYKIDNLAVIDVAEPADLPYNIGIVKNVCLFGLIGLIISCGIIFLIFYFDNTIKSQEEIESLLNIPVIASITKYTKEMEGKTSYGK